MSKQDPGIPLSGKATVDAVADQWGKILAIIMEKIGMRHIIITAADIDAIGKDGEMAKCLVVQETALGMHVHLLPPPRPSRWRSRTREASGNPDMTTFEDGPAIAARLFLKRAPIFLRVVEENGQWDALDQPEDKPKPGEKIHAYQIYGEPGSGFVNRRGGKGGFFVFATYRYVANQPTDEELRDTLLWRQWCLANRP